MTLPNGFLFNQSNLQDYVECQRRFQLRYLFHLAWPAVEVDPIHEYELITAQGLQFHKIIRQHLAGIPETQIERSLGDDEVMRRYWRNYLQSYDDGILGRIIKTAERHFEELAVSVPLGAYRLGAKFDSLVIRPDGNLVILDWKTSKIRQKREWLADRLQTHVYPFVLTHGIAGIANAGQVDPARIEMIYWFTNHPEQPESFSYSQQAYDADQQYFEGLVTEINSKTELVFPLTPDIRRCTFCNYRSLCDRGVKPGDLERLELWQASSPASESISIDSEQIGEIEF